MTEPKRRESRGFRALINIDDWAALVHQGVIAKHGPRDRLVHQGDTGGWVLLCLAGRSKVVYADPDGPEIMLAVRGPGDVIGEMSARDGRPRSATVQAIEPGIAAKLSKQRFEDLVLRRGLKGYLDTYILDKLRESAPHAWQLAHRTTVSRLASLLAEIIDAAGPDHPAATTIAMSQDELASALGLVRSAVTPVIAEWKSAGLIQIARGKLEVVDLPALTRAHVSSSGQTSPAPSGMLRSVTTQQARRSPGEPRELGGRPFDR